MAAKKVVPVSSDRNSQGQHPPFEQAALPPFQRERLEWIHEHHPSASALLALVEDLDSATGEPFRTE